MFVSVFVFVSVSVFVFGRLGVWAFGRLGVWVFGRLGVWVFGCGYDWVSCCVSGWLRARTFPRTRTIKLVYKLCQKNSQSIAVIRSRIYRAH